METKDFELVCEKSPSIEEVISSLTQYEKNKIIASMAIAGTDIFQCYQNFNTENGLMTYWNVTLALQMVKYRQPNGDAPVKEQLHAMSDDINHDYAMSRDLSIPLIAVTVPGGHIVIDGWHRIYKANKLGIEALLCHLFDEEESKCLLIYQIQY